MTKPAAVLFSIDIHVSYSKVVFTSHTGNQKNYDCHPAITNERPRTH